VLIPPHHSKTKRLPQSRSRLPVGIGSTSFDGASLDNRCNNYHKISKTEQLRKVRLGLMDVQRRVSRGTSMEKQLGLCMFCSSGGSKFVANPETGSMRFTGIKRCRSSWCVSCAAQKTTKIAERVVEVAKPQLIEGAKCYFGTLTMSKNQSIDQGYDTLMKAWGQFNSQFGQHIKRKAGDACWHAGLRGYDATFKVYEKDKYHHHIHFVLVFENDFFSSEWVREEITSRWCRILAKHGAKGSIGAQNLQEVSTDEVEAVIRYSTDPGKLNNTLKKDLRSAGFELTGAYKDSSVHGLTYVELLGLIKRTDCPQAKSCLQSFYNKVFGRRQVSTFGKWRFLEKELEELEDMTSDGVEVIEENGMSDIEIEIEEEVEEEEVDDYLMPGERVYLEFPKVVHNVVIKYAPNYPYSLIGAVMKGNRLREYNEFDALTKSFPYKDAYTADDKKFVRTEILGFIADHTGEVF
jgi:hypothetical protein